MDSDVPPDVDSSVQPGMAASESSHCPECGYDLRGIPEDRCPECGFGFELAAVRAIATQSAALRQAAYVRVLWLVGAALALALLSAGGSFTFWLIVIALCLLPCIWFSLWCISYALEQVGSVWKAAVGFVLLPPLMIAGALFPRTLHFAALVLVIWAVVRLAGLPSRYPYAEKSLAADARRTLRRWRLAAWVGLGAAVVSVVLLWV